MTETNVKRISTLEKNDELNRKHLQQRTTKKLNYLKFKPKNQSLSDENKEINHKEKATNKYYKSSYAIVLKRKSNTNSRRKFSKQNPAENEPSNSVKNPILNARRSHRTSRNKSTELTAAETPKTTNMRYCKMKLKL